MKVFIVFLMFFLPLIGISQIADDFSDGNFSLNPSWTGDSESFEVNSNGQLHLRTSGADTAVLATPNSMILNTEWDFWVKLSFNTSANNFARIYLTSDHADLKGKINGYYLQIGGSHDSIEFIRQNGDAHHVLFRGSQSFTGNTVNTFRIKMIHDAEGIWHLFSDKTGNYTFSEEGSCADTQIMQSSSFGIYCRFTSSNSTKFYFDDFYVGPVIIDSIPPDVLSVKAIDDSSLMVTFTEPVDPDEALKTANYVIPYHSSPYKVEIDSENPSVVHLLFVPKFANGTCDTLVVINVTDFHGNTASAIRSFFCFYEAKTYDIVISEIMADPTPQNGLPDAEYAELYNRTEFPVSLKNWIFQAGASEKILPDVTIQPASFLTLTKGSLLTFYGPSVDLFTSASTLTNEGTKLTLKNDENRVIHSVSYSTDWYHNSLKENGGWSLEMIDPDNPCGCMENWSASIDLRGGTPSGPNSVFRDNPDTIKPYLSRAITENDSAVIFFFSESIDSSSFGEIHEWITETGNTEVVRLSLIPPAYSELILHVSPFLEKGFLYKITSPGGIKDCSGNLLEPVSSVEFAIPEIVSESDIIINEILPNPFPYGERFIELYNRSEKIFDLKSLVLLDLDTVSGDGNNPVTISEEGYLIFPGKFAVLTKDPSDIIFRYYAPDEDCLIKISSVPSMNDDAGEVIIARKNDLKIIDKITYTEEMNFPLLASPEGVSIERLDPSGSSESRSNWHSASASCGFATPGYRNSQFIDPGLTEDPIVLSSEIFSPDNDGKDDMLIIHFHFDRPGYVANVSVFNSSGRLVRQLVRNELISPEGFFSWDGTTRENQKAAIGIYIIWIELFTPDGIVRHFKKPVVLAGRF